MVELTKLSKGDFDSILTNYNIGTYKNHKHIFAGENTIYKLITTKGTFILKIYEKASKGFIDYQVSLMEFLRDTEVKTPKVILTNKKKGLLVWKKKRIVLQEFAKGKVVHYANKNLSRDMGRKYSLMNKTLAKFKGSTKGDMGWSGPFKLIKWHPTIIAGIDPSDESKNLLREINKLEKNKLRKQLIHSDLSDENFLAKDDKITAIIDWDEVHVDYLIYELAIPIAHNMVTPQEVRKDSIKIFLREYQKRIRLNEEEKKALYYFIKHRELYAGLWCYQQIKRHQDRKQEMTQWTEQCIRKYKVFSKLSLNQFLHLIE